MSTPEFQARTSSLSNSDYVLYLWREVLGMTWVPKNNKDENVEDFRRMLWNGVTEDVHEYFGTKINVDC